jgi:LmbE family N-acetylglucosaminyl deacetylase
VAVEIARADIRRRLLAVHAHPDDESITTGGLLARCARTGIRACLVTCTDGRYGPVNPELGVTLTPQQLARVRGRELRAAARILEIAKLRQFGYHDSGMAGSPRNTEPGAFWVQPADAVVGRLVHIIRQFRPHVVVTYDPFGCTGHPDHIQAHRITVLAFGAAAEPRQFPDAGHAWAAGHLLYPVFAASDMERFIERELRAGLPHPMGGLAADDISYTRPDHVVTHRVAIGDLHDRKEKALHAHRSQVGPHYPQLYRAALARRDFEHFRVAITRVSAVDFSDLFEPVIR